VVALFFVSVVDFGLGAGFDLVVMTAGLAIFGH
jgi:hypothetical protein